MEMKTVKELPDGRTEVETVINGCNVTVVFAKEDNLETMKNIIDLIMSAYAEGAAPFQWATPGLFLFMMDKPSIICCEWGRSFSVMVIAIRRTL